MPWTQAKTETAVAEHVLQLSLAYDIVQRIFRKFTESIDWRCSVLPKIHHEEGSVVMGKPTLHRRALIHTAHGLTFLPLTKQACAHLAWSVCMGLRGGGRGLAVPVAVWGKQRVLALRPVFPFSQSVCRRPRSPPRRAGRRPAGHVHSQVHRYPLQLLSPRTVCTWL